MQNEILAKQTFYLQYIMKHFALLSITLQSYWQWTNNTVVLNFHQRLVHGGLGKWYTNIEWCSYS